MICRILDQPDLLDAPALGDLVELLGCKKSEKLHTKTTTTTTTTTSTNTPPPPHNPAGNGRR